MIVLTYVKNTKLQNGERGSYLCRDDVTVGKCHGGD